MSQTNTFKAHVEQKWTLFSLCLVTACLTVATFYGWQVLWGWGSPLLYTAGLVIAAVGLWSARRVVRLLVIALCLYTCISLGSDMYAEWREYWSAGASAQEALLQSLYPVWEPFHVALALAILIVAVARPKDRTVYS